MRSAQLLYLFLGMINAHATEGRFRERNIGGWAASNDLSMIDEPYRVAGYFRLNRTEVF